MNSLFPTASPFAALRRGLMPLLAALLLATAAVFAPASAQSKQQSLIDECRVIGERLINDPEIPDLARLMPKAKGVLIIPQLLKGGFFIGGAGGHGCMLARNSDTWSYPSFYIMGSGSLGLQIGGQVSQIMLLMMTDDGLNAVLNNRFTFGAEANIAIATVGAGIEGSTTTAGGLADIYAFSKNQGLFAGGALEGSYVAPDDDWNTIYYGGQPTARGIILEGRYSNPGANGLRTMLGNY